MDWFSVDKSGLAKLIDKRGKSFVVFELLQNAWDTAATTVRVQLTPAEGRPMANIVVEDDDPSGFQNLAHAFTLFAESEKKGDPTKRGRFNLGEKLVLALCEQAEIMSTKGSVVFDPNGRRTTRNHLAKGSIFSGWLRMTRAELAQVQRDIRTLIPPEGLETTFNGEPLPSRPIVKTIGCTLPTEIADEEGYLRKTERKTTLTVHEVRPGEVPMLYEMGIPVVGLSGGEKWHVNIHQKVPLNVDRDNVTPAYLQTVRVVLANSMRDTLTKDDASQVWVTAATEDDRIESDTVSKVLDERFGKKRAIFDPSDPEANKQLMNEGYTIISGGSLSGPQWGVVKGASLATPSGKIRPSGIKYALNGRPENVVPPEKYTAGQRRIVAYTVALGRKLLQEDLEVRIVSEITMAYAACFGGGTLTFNLGRLGKAWFEKDLGDSHHELIMHEFAHHKVGDHLTREFADEVCRLSVKLARQMYVDPEFFREAGYVP